MSRPKLKPGHVWIEVVSGVEGPCLCIGDENGVERVAGPKSWGGGKIIYEFQVKTDDLRRLAEIRGKA